MAKKGSVRFLVFMTYLIFIFFSYVTNFETGEKIAENFIQFSIGMLKVLPCAFILIGLFEVWVKKETIQKNFGDAAGVRGYLWAILLAATTVGGVYVAFPIAHSLYNKGAKLSVIFTYLGASAVCRIPMTIFEASFVGLKFTLIRYLTSLPLIILSSILLEKYFLHRGYQMPG